MTAVAPFVRTPTRAIQPFDLDAIDANPRWRHNFAWPRAYPATAGLAEKLQNAAVTALTAMRADEIRDVAILMGADALATMLPLTEAAYLIEAERSAGITLHGSASVLAYLRGDIGEQPSGQRRRAPRPIQRPKMRLIRRWARTATWTAPAALPRAMLQPDAWAVSHNALLRDVARRSDLRIRFAHGETLYDTLCRPSGGVKTPDCWRGVAATFSEAALDAVDLSADVTRRLRQLIADACARIAEQAAQDLVALRAAKLPDRLWAGTGGYWPVRAMSLETLRRGGEVTRFDHGGGFGFNRYPARWALSELSVSSRFIVPTQALANRVLATGAAEMLAPPGGTTVGGAAGDPHAGKLDLLRRTARRPGCRRVFYGPGPLIGARQMVPALLPDPVALDWQLRLVEQLKALPMELICRPHPEGLLRDRRHPVAALVDPARESFEELVPDIDVFVFDYAQSTTFYVALCTDRPIVLLDMGARLFGADAAEAIAQRCRILRVEFGDDNLPRVDPARLHAAVCDDPTAADPGFFRALILGESVDGSG